MVSRLRQNNKQKKLNTTDIIELYLKLHNPLISCIECVMYMVSKFRFVFLIFWWPTKAVKRNLYSCVSQMYLRIISFKPNSNSVFRFITQVASYYISYTTKRK